jgi:hypothetical protein
MAGGARPNNAEGRQRKQVFNSLRRGPVVRSRTGPPVTLAKHVPATEKFFVVSLATDEFAPRALAPWPARCPHTPAVAGVICWRQLVRADGLA